MKIFGSFGGVLKELKSHAPFTLVGAVVGLLCMLVFKDIGHDSSEKLFRIFHPLHVLLSALVTASLFKINQRKYHFFTVLLIGYFGSIGVATLSDSIIPYLGEGILGVAYPSHMHAHECDHQIIEKNTDQSHLDVCNEDHDHVTHAIDNASHEQHSCDSQQPRKLHLGFIKDWYSVTPAALLGVFIAFFLPSTKFPHTAHVLLSTWASSAHIMMNIDIRFNFILLAGMFSVLFISVWLPCCLSDIVFPMLFIKDPKQRPSSCCH